MEHELSERKEHILAFVVTTYVETAQPVGSRILAKKFASGWSPATIRNEMSDLEEAAYITHPHTSAGRVPTDKGYRYYIDYLMKNQSVPSGWAALVAREFRREVHSINELIDKTSKVLSAITQQASVVIYPSLEQLFCRRVDLVSIDDQHVLVVWFTTSGAVHHHVVDVGEQVTPDKLERIRNLLNTELPHRNIAEAEACVLHTLAERRDSLAQLAQLAGRIVSQSLKSAQGHRVCVEGMRYILEQPEFHDVSKAQQIFHALDDKETLLELLQQPKEHMTAQVCIGREMRAGSMQDCALVSTNYPLKDTVGSLGIVGPRRMRYPQMIALVEHMARQIARVFEQWY